MTGGARASQRGFFVQPTVFADVTDDMTIAREEVRRVDQHGHSGAPVFLCCSVGFRWVPLGSVRWVPLGSVWFRWVPLDPDGFR